MTTPIQQVNKFNKFTKNIINIQYPYSNYKIKISVKTHQISFNITLTHSYDLPRY
jgi:hypothetical protein